jgi:serine/threonine-protein kinase RsbW
MIDNPEILSIKSDLSEIKKVEKFLFRIFEKNNLPQKIFNKVFLCISEAVVNAIEHGNRGDNQKEVLIKINCKSDCMTVAIRDEGDGFNYGEVEDPTRRDNLMNEGGRGIYIIRSLCSQLAFSSKGKCIEIKIDLS